MSVLSDEEKNKLFAKFNPYAPDIFLDLVEQATIDKVAQVIQGMTSSDVFFDNDLCPYTINAIAEKIKAKMQE